MARALALALGEPALHEPLTPEAFSRQPFPGAAGMASSFAYQQRAEASYCAARRPEVARSLHPDLLDFSQWACSRAGLLRQLCDR